MEHFYQTLESLFAAVFLSSYIQHSKMVPIF